MREQADPLELCCRDLTEWFGRGGPSHSIQAVERTDVALGTSIGPREENQDRVAVARFFAEVPGQSFLLLIVCDGIGGMEAGGLCASITLAHLIVWLAKSKVKKMSDRLLGAVQAANYEVHRLFDGNGGSTCACIVLDERGSAVGMHIGDSRIYQYSPKQKSLVAITVDHNIGNQIDQLIPSENKEKRQSTFFSHQITQFVGQGSDLQPTLQELFPSEDQHYLITSDGAHSLVPETFKRLVARAQSPQEVVRRVLAVANWCGSEDNASAICVRSLNFSELHEAPFGRNYLQLWDAFGKFSLRLPLSEVSSRVTPELESAKEVDLQFGVLPVTPSDFKNKRAKKNKSQPRRPQKEKNQAHVPKKQPPEIELIKNE